jgi:hypothetical protein
MKKLNLILITIMIVALFVAPVGFVHAQDGTDTPEVTETIETPEVTETPEPGETETPTTLSNPVIMFLAGLTNRTSDDILAIQQEGFGLGEIAKAYTLLTMFLNADFVRPDGMTFEGTTIEDVLAMRADTGWGNIFKEFGVHPGNQKGIGQYFKASKNDDSTSEETQSLDAANTKKGGRPDFTKTIKDKPNKKHN